MKSFAIALTATCLILASCNKVTEIDNGDLKIEFNKQMHSKINLQSGTPLMNDFVNAEYLETPDFKTGDFTLNSSDTKEVTGKAGKGKSTILSGSWKNTDYSLEKIVTVTVFDSFPDMAFYKVRYVNKGERELQVTKWVNHQYLINETGDSPAFWSFQGSSTGAREDWMLPVDSAFSQKNFMGMNNTDYGGGIPVLDIWRKDAGLAIGHTEMVPRMISLPVNKSRYEKSVRIDLEFEYPEAKTLGSGDTLNTYDTYVSVHHGDCFASLQAYSKYMQANGIKLAPVEDAAYEAVWCAWGYMRKFTVAEVLGTLPKVKELGLKWVDIDDGYQQAEGDWDVVRDKFPRGDADMRAMVDKIHSMGMKAKLWWAPLAVDPGSKLLKENPDIILETSDGAPQFITWWDSYYMSPVYQKTIHHTRSVLKMFLKDWDFDGLKMDGQHLNCVPPDYNYKHDLKDPMESFEKLPDFYKMIYQTAKTYKPDAVLQICPCGDAMSFFNMPWTNQTVASDPTSSWQIRLKGKTYKALLGKAAYYGDHVELSDNGDDFGTQIGIGAVLGTKFTWPKDNPYVTEGHFVLTPEREKIWKKWISVYNEKMLPKGEYLGYLYDIGYDKPETHVISKDSIMYYAFYSPEWKGKIELRGLPEGSYKITDYVNGKELGTVNSDNPLIDVEFKRNLLIQASRVQ
jgi:alpha-galactosidase